MAVAAVMVGGLLASVLPSGADVSADSPSVAAIRVESPATLLARGAAAAVTLSVVCTPGADAFVNVTVTEAVGNRIASGGNSGPITCTGGFQSILINVAAQVTPFRRGVAFAQSSIFVSGGLASSADEREITIVAPRGTAEAV
jgi:hypothetical protein